MKNISSEGGRSVALSAVVASIVIGIDPSNGVVLDGTLESRIQKARSASVVDLAINSSNSDENGQTMQFPNFPNYFNNFPNFPNYFRNW